MVGDCGLDSFGSGRDQWRAPAYMVMNLWDA